MKKMYDRFQHIRMLLDRYYDGLTSSGEEREIIRFFSETAGPLPADLEAERRFFIAMSGLVDSVDEMPEAVARRIELALEAEAASGRGNRWNRRRPLWRFAAAVACVALLAVGIGHIGSGEKDSGTVSGQLATVTSCGNPDVSAEAVADDADPETGNLPEEAVGSVCKARSCQEIRQTEGAARDAVRSADGQDSICGAGMRLVTDSVEAVRITAGVMELLASNISAGEEACRRADKSITETINRIKDIL